MTPAPATPGTVAVLDGRPTLRFERHFRHGIERVWRAVTEPSEMKAWFPSAVVGDRRVGAPLIFDDDAQRAAARAAGEPTRDDGPMFHGTVQTWDPPTSWSFTWGGELIRIELRSDGDGTVMTFTQRLSHESVAARNGAGWHLCLAALADHLGEAAPVAAASDGEEELHAPGWKAMYDDYLERIGPPLGTPAADGSMTWERSIHVSPERVIEATSDPAALDVWGGTGHVGADTHWDTESAEVGTTYRLTVDGIGSDARAAATWHALLLQLDMYLAAGQLVPADPDDVLSHYAELLAGAEGAASHG